MNMVEWVKGTCVACGAVGSVVEWLKCPLQPLCLACAKPSANSPLAYCAAWFRWRGWPGDNTTAATLEAAINEANEEKK